MPSELLMSELLYRRLLEHVEYEAIFGAQDIDAYQNTHALAFSTGIPANMNLPEHSESLLGRMRYRFVVRILPRFGLTTNNSLQRSYSAYHGAIQQAAQLSVSREQIANALHVAGDERDHLASELKKLQGEQAAQNEQFERITKEDLRRVEHQVGVLETSLHERDVRVKTLETALAERELSLRRAQQALNQRDQIILEYQQLSIERDRAVNDLFKTFTLPNNSVSFEKHS